jgi:hypothetical protein
VQLRDEIQTTLSGRIQMERDELGKKLDDLAHMENSNGGAVGSNGVRRGRPVSKGRVQSANGKAGPRKRKPVPIQYYDAETGSTYSNRGPMATWLRAKKEAGVDIEKKYRVSKSNPLPKKLAHLTAPQ